LIRSFFGWCCCMDFSYRSKSQFTGRFIRSYSLRLLGLEQIEIGVERRNHAVLIIELAIHGSAPINPVKRKRQRHEIDRNILFGQHLLAHEAGRGDDQMAHVRGRCRELFGAGERERSFR
jgi:hypothetical protein